MKKTMYIIGALLFIVAYIYAIKKGTEGTKEYNRHICVDVYGKDENCK